MGFHELAAGRLLSLHRRGRRRELILADGSVSYGGLYRRSRRVAAALHEAGLRRGDGVALVLPNCRELLEVTWACQLSGLYYSAVYTHFTPDEVPCAIGDSDARAVFVDASMTVFGERVDPDLVRIVVGGNLPGWWRYDVAVADAGAPPVADRRQRLVGADGAETSSGPAVFDPILHEYYGGTEGFAGSTIGPQESLAHPWQGRSSRIL